MRFALNDPSADRVATTVRRSEHQTLNPFWVPSFQRQFNGNSPILLCEATEEIPPDGSIAQCRLMEGQPGVEVASADSLDNLTVVSIMRWPVWVGSKLWATLPQIAKNEQSTVELSAWYVIVSNAASRIRGEVDVSLGENDSGQMSSIVPIDGHFGEVNATVYHVSKNFTTRANGLAWAEWNITNSRWELYQADC